MFGGFHKLKLNCFGGFLDQITTGKKVQSSGHRLECLGGSTSSSSDCFLRVPRSNYDRKTKRYSRLAIGWNVWGVPRARAWIVLAGSSIKLRPEKKGLPSNTGTYQDTYFSRCCSGSVHHLRKLFHPADIGLFMLGCIDGKSRSCNRV
jgi:hypothetical protein